MKNNKEKILVIGSGGREHAIVDALSRSLRVEKIYCAPGNAGISEMAECVKISPTDIPSLVDFAKNKGIDLTIVGPEASLAAGVVDEFRKGGLRIFGPDREATRIESSKEFAKRIMAKYGVPTGDYKTFTDYEAACEYVMSRPLPAVIKYDGLAAGKGVVVATSYDEANAALKDMLLDSSFGEGKVIIEEFLSGPEFSFMCVVSGEKVYPLEIAQDHKRAYDGDHGPNTGGMGAYSPVPFITDDIRREALEKIIKPVARGLVEEGVPFVGVLYGGLILTEAGPKVIEFNARFGDPETEVVLPRLNTDILDLFEAAIEGKECDLNWSDKACLGIVLASEGYPGKYEKGVEIKGLEYIEGKIYHCGTLRDSEGRLLTNGGRVIMIVGAGTDLNQARSNALKEIGKIECRSLFHRSDIGKAAIEIK